MASCNSQRFRELGEDWRETDEKCPGSQEGALDEQWFEGRRDACFVSRFSAIYFVCSVSVWFVNSHSNDMIEGFDETVDLKEDQRYNE